MKVRLDDLKSLADAVGMKWSIVQLCIRQTAGDWADVDEMHPAYPDYVRNRLPQDAISDHVGPGAQLKKLLSKLGLRSKSGCACNARAAEMNARGVEWCEANVGEIVGWLREEAMKRKLPFVDAAGRFLVRKAIRMAKAARPSGRPQ